uniref:Uncharacterized protein n=1 Tax=Ciona savignyi TaxID=51511 RepID=H2YK63_CIOSA
MRYPFETLDTEQWLQQSFEHFGTFDFLNQSWSQDDWANCQHTDNFKSLKLKFKSLDTIQVTEVINIPYTGRYYVIMLIETEQAMEFDFELKMGGKDGFLNKYELRDCRTQILFCAIYIMTLVLITGIRNTNNRPLYLLLSAVITSEICCYILVTALFINFDSLGTVDVRLTALTLFFEVMSGTIFRFLILSL